MAATKGHRRQWRFYETAAGNKPVKDFLDDLPAADAAEIVATMKYVARAGLRAARHLRGDIWEVRADGENRIYRLLFSAEGRFGQVLLALEGFTKKTQKTPPKTIQRWPGVTTMDDLERYVSERERREAGFAQLVAAAESRQEFARKLAERRRSSGKTQTQVAAVMETSASIVSRLEAGADVRVSTLEKYVSAIGMKLDFRAVPRPPRARRSKAAAKATVRTSRKASRSGAAKKK